MSDESGRKAALFDYMDYATVHGIGRTKNTPFLVFKIFWVLALLASLAMIIWQVHDLYLKYDSNPISTTVEVKTAKRLKFPPITICNTNPAKYSLIEPGSTLDEVIKVASKKYSIDLDIYNSSDIYNYNYSSFDERNKNSTLENDIMWKTAEQFRMKMATLDNFELENISQPLPEFFLVCNFAGKPCDREAITTIRSYAYGQCYKFEPEYVADLTPHGKVADAGPKNSLEILLNVDQYDSIPFVTPSAGVVIGSDSRSKFFHENHGVFVPTGFETNIALTQVNTERVTGRGESPRCKSESEDPYSILDCHRACKLQDYVNSCNCYLYFFDIGVKNKSISLNNTFDEEFGYAPCYSDEHYKCIQELDAAYILEPMGDCDSCLPPCSDIDYETDVSQMTWPGANFIPILRKIVQSKLNNYMSSSEVDRNYVRDNFVLVRIYLSSLSYQIIKEEYTYSEVDFISDIGGQLGLWAGFSVLSLCEVLELFLLLCASGMKRKTSRDNIVNPVEKY